MTGKASRYIWHNGRLVPWEDATVHVLSHGLHYGSSVFEGVRVYGTPRGPMGFRLQDHLTRMYNSAKLYRIDIPFSQEDITRACHESVIANGLQGGAYLRPIAYRGMAGLGVTAPPDSPVEVAIAAIEWGAYLGAEGLEKGVDVCVSSWQRVAPNTIPSGAKAGGNYLSSFLVHMEANDRGYTEGIALGADGLVSEGSGENIFVVRDGRILTPPVAASILGGITRDTAIHLARDLGLDIQEQAVSREQLYAADEIFMTGTAVEITPVRRVDHLDIGTGDRGPVTKAVQDAFFGLFDGRTEDKRGWLEAL